jgi:hypothetical protein
MAYISHRLLKLFLPAKPLGDMRHHLSADGIKFNHKASLPYDTAIHRACQRAPDLVIRLACHNKLLLRMPPPPRTKAPDQPPYASVHTAIK